MRNRADHAPDLGPVGLLDGVIDPPQAERAQRPALAGLDPDGRTHLGDPQRRRHHATSVTSGFLSVRSRYARSIPADDTSSGDLPRSFATSSGRRRLCRPVIVARETLIAFAEPSDFASTSCTPAASRMARAAPPAITPVPGAAGFSRTRAASCTPTIWWVIVVPARATGNRFLRASSIPFWMAAGTSLAFPYPRPTLPLLSPTTTSA